MIIPPSTRKYVRVSVNVPQVSGAFDYHLPEGMQQEVQPGCLLEVPFGSQLVQGIVLELIDHPAVEETKPIHHLVDADPVVTADQLRLAAWMEHNSLNTLSQCVDQMLLPGLSKQAEVVFTPTGQEIPGQLKPIQSRILQLVSQQGSLRTRQLDAAFPRVDWRSAARSLVQQGYLTTRSHLTRPSLHPKLVRRIQLAARVEDISFTDKPLASNSVARMGARRAIIAYLAENPEPIDLQWVRANLAVDFNQSDLNALEEAEIIRLWESEVIRDPVERIKPEIFAKHILTPTQSTIWAEIQSSLKQVGESHSTKPVFLFGVTGSGKTELYLRAVNPVCSREKG